MIVVDTNVIAYLLIAGNKTEFAQNTYRKDNNWIVPGLWRHEFLNVLSTFIRLGGGQPEDGQRLWEQGLALFGEKEMEVDMVAALDLSIEHNLSAYDTQFVVLAQVLQTQLVTEDRKLLHAFPETAQSMRDYLVTAE